MQVEGARVHAAKANQPGLGIAPEAFNSIDVTTAKISINGITTLQERVVEYVRTMEQSKVFTSVSIIWIDRASNKDMGISFLIAIER